MGWAEVSNAGRASKTFAEELERWERQVKSDRCRNFRSSVGPPAHFSTSRAFPFPSRLFNLVYIKEFQIFPPESELRGKLSKALGAPLRVVPQAKAWCGRSGRRLPDVWDSAPLARLATAPRLLSPSQATMGQAVSIERQCDLAPVREEKEVTKYAWRRTEALSGFD